MKKAEQQPPSKNQQKEMMRLSLAELQNHREECKEWKQMGLG